MKKILNILVPIMMIFLIGFSIFYLNKNNKNIKPEITKIDNSKDTPQDNKTWISKVVGQVAVERNMKKINVNSGDEVYVKDIIETQKNSSAVLIFADGSKTDIAQNTKFEVKSLDYKSEKDNIVYLVLNLITGSVYNTVDESKPHRFDVETAHAVATVRGTEFAVEVKNDKAQIKAFKHAVKIKSIDSKGNRSEKEIELKEGRKMAMNLDKIEKESDLDLADKQMMVQDFRDKAMQKREALQELIIDKEFIENKVEIKEVLKDKIEEKNTLNKKPVSLQIFLDPKADLRSGKNSPISAYLVYTDNTRENVLSKVAWDLNSNVGSIRNGVFTAKLPDEYSEIGEIFGTVKASMVIDGVKFESNTLKIRIEDFYEENNLAG